MADDLRSSLEAAVSQVETAASNEAAATPAPAPAPAPTPAPPAAPAPAPASKPEGEPADGETNAPTGKKDGEPPATPPKNGENTDEGAEGDDPAKQKQPTGAERAPQSWKPSTKAKWDKVDPEVRQEIIRRERETARALSESSQARKFSDGFKKAASPYVGRFTTAGIPPEKAVISLMHVDNTLATAPADKRADLMATLILDYGIDLPMLDAALSAKSDGKQVDPLSSRLTSLIEERLAPVTQFIQTTEQQRQEAIRRDFEQQKQTVESMATDPKYPLFDLVREDMADLIEVYARRGVDVPLAEAYNRAVQMNPEASAQAKELTKQGQAQEANARAQRALGASLSVSGAPAAVKAGIDPSDLRATLEAAVLANSGR